jgi:hypothetical protein
MYDDSTDLLTKQQRNHGGQSSQRFISTQP